VFETNSESITKRGVIEVPHKRDFASSKWWKIEREDNRVIGKRHPPDIRTPASHFPPLISFDYQPFPDHPSGNFLYNSFIHLFLKSQI
jgi:hypothetical protein